MGYTAQKMKRFEIQEDQKKQRIIKPLALESLVKGAEKSIRTRRWGKCQTRQD